MTKSITERVEEKGYRVEWNNGNYKVYYYNHTAEAYVFHGYYTKSELKNLL